MENQAGTKLAPFFGNYVVTLSCVLKREGQLDHLNNATAFVVSIAGVWFLATAGHVLEVLDKQKEEGTHVDWLLDDTMGSNAISDHPIPFNLAARHDYRMPHDGYDYALIEILDHDRQLLERNGIKPITEQAWTQDYPQEFMSYILVGFPEEYVRSTPQAVSKEMLMADLKPIPLADVPHELTSIKSAPRLYFWHNMEHDAAPKSLVGTSGGPIFGFQADREGNIRMWLVGIQSAQATDYPIAIVCPTRPFFHYVQQQILSLVDPTPQDNPETAS